MLDFNYLSIFWWLCDPPNRANQSRIIINLLVVLQCESKTNAVGFCNL